MPRPDVSEERMGQILGAAEKVFARSGFHTSSMDDIVEESGLSKGAVYWYFASKDDLIAALAERIFDRELRGLKALVTLDAPATDRLLIATRGVADDIERISKLASVAFEFYAVASRQKRVRRFLREYFAGYRKLLAAIIKQGVDYGEFREVDPRETAITLIALYEGLTLLWIVDPSAVEWRKAAESGVRALLEGIVADGAGIKKT